MPRPEVELRLQLRARHALVLPGHEVDIADWRRRQLGGPAGESGGVKLAELFQQQILPPSVGDDMRQPQQQQVLALVEADQLDPQQRRLGEVEGSRRLGPEQPPPQRCTVLLLVPCKVVPRNSQERSRRDRLRDAFRGFDEGGAEDLMTVHHGLQRGGQGFDVQSSAQAHQPGGQSKLLVAHHPGAEPLHLLLGRQRVARQVRQAGDADGEILDRGAPLRPGRLDKVRDSGGHEELADGYLDPQPPAQLGH